MTKLNISAERARLAMTCMAKRDIRYYLCGILVEPRPAGGVFIVGTDGARLIVVIDETGECEEPTILSIDQALQQRCAKPGAYSKNVQRLQLDEFRGKPALLLTDGVTGELPDYVKFNPIVEGKFPAWRNVLPDLSKVTRGCAMAFNADLLHTVLSVFKDRTTVRAIPYQRAVDSEIAFHLLGHEYAFFVIMPLRDGGAPIAPLVARWPNTAVKSTPKKEEVPA